MRDIFEDIFSGERPDPVEAVRRAVRPQLRKRFYARAEVADDKDGFRVLLDGKPVRTPARRTLAAPARAIAEAIAAEWEARTDVIDPARMPLTRLANAIIDGVVDAPAAVADEIMKYLASDLLFYRAERPDQLVARQAAAWDPVLAWARDALGAHFVLSYGVVHVAQAPAALAAARTALPESPWALGALASVTTLTGSALLGLALARGAIALDAAWAAANVDEDWNMETWGRDAVILERRDFRYAEMLAAGTVLRSLG